MFAFAGLGERWEDPAGEALDTFTILTTDPNELVRPLHNRLTVILPPDSWDLWLDPESHDKQQLTDLLWPWPADDWRLCWSAGMSTARVTTIRRALNRSTRPMVMRPGHSSRGWFDNGVVVSRPTRHRLV